MNIGPRLKQTRLEKGLSQAKLAQLSGVSQGLIAQIEAGTNQGSKHVTKIAKALDVDADWLAGGTGTSGRATPLNKELKKDAAPKKWPFKTINEDDLRALSGRDAILLEGAISLAIAQLKLGVRVDSSAHSLPAGQPAPLGTVFDTSTVEDPFPFTPSKPMPWDIPPVDSPRPHREDLRINTAVNVGRVTDTGYSANDQEYLPVPELSVRLAAGQLGIENYSETEIGEIMFRRSFLASLGLPIERMKIVYADGDSMAPVIRDKAPMLFYEELISDPSQIDTRTVYAINYGGKMIVKCLVRNRFNKWMARSLNPAHKDFPLAEDDGSEVRIVGRILWSPYDLRDGVDERLVRR